MLKWNTQTVYNRPFDKAVPELARRFAPTMFLLTWLYLVVIGIVLHWWNLAPVLDENDRTLTLKLLSIVWLPFLVEAIVALFAVPSYPGKLQRILLVLAFPPARLGISPMTAAGWIWLPRVGWRRKTPSLYRYMEKVLALPMLWVALLILPLLGVEYLLSDLVHKYQWLKLALDAGVVFIWIAFAAELSIMLTLAPNKLAYLKGHWLNVLIVILPFFAMLRSLRLVRVAQLSKSSKLLRAYRLRSVLMRGYESLLALSVLERLLNRDPVKERDKLIREIKSKTQELKRLEARLIRLEREILDEEQKEIAGTNDTKGFQD